MVSACYMLMFMGDTGQQGRVRLSLVPVPGHLELPPCQWVITYIVWIVMTIKYVEKIIWHLTDGNTD